MYNKILKARTAKTESRTLFSNYNSVRPLFLRGGFPMNSMEICIPTKFKSLMNDRIISVIDSLINIITSDYELNKMYNSMKMYSQALSAHSFNVTILSLALSDYLRYPLAQSIELGLGGMFHDVGKIFIPPSILFKPSRLTVDEYAKVMKHPTLGHDAVKGCNLSNTTLSIILLHHYCSNGYPVNPSPKYKSSEPVHIVTLADCYDAMTSNRSYQKRRSLRDALDEINRHKGSLFQSDLADLFQEVVRHAC